MIDERLDFLIYGWLDGRLTSAERGELETRLFTEPESRDRFWRLAGFHSALASSTHLLPAEPPSSPLRTATERLTFLALGGPVREADRWSTAVALLASYVVFYGACFALLWSLRPQPIERRPRLAAEIAQLAEEDLAKGVATLVDGSDCQWEAGRPPTPAGGRITAATPLRLLSGQAIVRFDRGAEVGLVGPVEARLNSGGRMFLKHGRIAAHVPARACGFIVETITARLVDLGTDFAVDVSEMGATKMNVSRGAVEVTPLAAIDGKPSTIDSPLRVTAGQSVTVSRLGGRLTIDRGAKSPDWVNELKLNNESPATIIAYQTLNGTAGNEGNEELRGFGLDFDVVRPIRIEALGAFDDLGDGIAPETELTVQLWSRDNRGTPLNNADDQAGRVMAELRFDAASPGLLMAGHRFKSLAAPLELPPGSYTIVGYGFSALNRDLNFKYPGARPREIETWHGAIEQIGSRHGSGVPGQFPLILPGNNAIRYYFAAGSFKFCPLDAAEFTTPRTDLSGEEK